MMLISQTIMTWFVYNKGKNLESKCENKDRNEFSVFKLFYKDSLLSLKRYLNKF